MADDATGVETRQRRILGTIWWTLPLVLLGVPALDLWVVPAPAIDGRGERITLALQCNAVALMPYFAVCMKIATTRFLEGAHDPLSMNASPSLAIDCRVMQNHLEQLVAFAIAALALATVLPAEHLQLLPIATVFFVLARAIYGWGYHRQGTLGRAPGVQMTFAITVPMVLGAFVLVLLRAFA
ncbi:MAG: MAPEG family protein [Deltaproteobacteria bacterium]|nr:MAPEG family protein [Nannocystaceae bacterium]